jgi:hypothetical protein
MATHTHPAGSLLSYDTDGVSTFTDLAELIAIMPASPKRQPSPNTNLESTDKIIKRTAGMIDPGEGSFRCYFTKTQYNTLIGFFDSGTEYYWKLSTPLIDTEATKSTLVWTGFVSSVEWESIERDSDDKLAVTFAITNTSKPTFTAGS